MYDRSVYDNTMNGLDSLLDNDWHGPAIANSLQLGNDPEGERVWWHPFAQPHLTIAGPVGSGRTVLARNLVSNALVSNWKVHIIPTPGAPVPDPFADLRSNQGLATPACFGPHEALMLLLAQMEHFSRVLGNMAPPIMVVGEDMGDVHASAIATLGQANSSRFMRHEHLLHQVSILTAEPVDFAPSPGTVHTVAPGQAHWTNTDHRTTQFRFRVPTQEAPGH